MAEKGPDGRRESSEKRAIADARSQADDDQAEAQAEAQAEKRSSACDWTQAEWDQRQSSLGPVFHSEEPAPAKDEAQRNPA